MEITQKKLFEIIQEEMGRIPVPTKLRGQHDRGAYASGVFEKAKVDQNKDGENDFDDVKIARMLASDEFDSIEQIKKAHPDLFEKYINEKKKKRKKRKKQKASDIPGYRRGRSKKQLKQLDRVTKKAASGKFTSADYEREDKRRQRELPSGHKTPKNPFTGKIAVGEKVEREELRALLEEILKQELEEKRKRRKKKKKRATLSKKTMATLRKKAKASGYTAGSLASEYRKGLGAYYTSGSRKGMGAHQWAMARVNSAIGKGNPSWANLKRSKAKKS